jgi:acetyl esterase/lipase
MRPADIIGKLPMLPRSPGVHPVIVFVHGGCGMPQAARSLAAMGDELKKDGIASWNIEYRRVGQPGGGWPGTYLDVGHAIHYLRTIGRTSGCSNTNQSTRRWSGRPSRQPW